MFASSNTFFLWGHGADLVRGEYRLKPDEYLLMSAECGLPIISTSFEDETYLKSLMIDKTKIPIPTANTPESEYAEDIYGVWYSHMYRPKQGPRDNPVYYKIPALKYQPLNINVNYAVELEKVTYEGHVYGSSVSNPVVSYILGVSGIMRPGTKFEWPEELIQYSNGVRKYVRPGLVTVKYENTFEIVPIETEKDPYNENFTLNIHCIVPRAVFSMTLEEALEADPLSRRFAETIVAAYSASFLTLEEIIKLAGSRKLVDIVNFTIEIKDIYEFIRAKGIEGPVLVIHNICRSLDRAGDPKAPIEFPRSFNSRKWRQTGVDKRRQILYTARERNPRNNGYVSNNLAGGRGRHKRRHTQRRKRT